MIVASIARRAAWPARFATAFAGAPALRLAQGDVPAWRALLADPLQQGERRWAVWLDADAEPAARQPARGVSARAAAATAAAQGTAAAMPAAADGPSPGGAHAPGPRPAAWRDAPGTPAPAGVLPAPFATMGPAARADRARVPAAARAAARLDPPAAPARASASIAPGPGRTGSPPSPAPAAMPAWAVAAPEHPALAAAAPGGPAAPGDPARPTRLVQGAAGLGRLLSLVPRVAAPPPSLSLPAAPTGTQGDFRADPPQAPPPRHAAAAAAPLGEAAVPLPPVPVAETLDADALLDRLVERLALAYLREYGSAG